MTAATDSPRNPTPAKDAGARAVARCDALGVPPYSEAADQLFRPYLSAAHRAALEALGVWMAEAGMTVRIDGAANLIGRYEGLERGAPALMIGSHIDSVRNGGRYDGALGVMLGVEAAQALHDRRTRLPFAVEVIAFGDEEGSRFPTSMTCSRAVAGTADLSVLDQCGPDGVALVRALADFEPGLPPFSSAARRPGDILAYLEAHIEQGPVLEAEGLGIGVVTAIAAQKRLSARFTGMAGHAGTTPMDLRRDPGPAAAEAILLVERVCGAEPGVVGTVGRIAALPGAVNVIPGEIVFSIDVRAPTAERRDAAAALIGAGVAEIAARRGLGQSVVVDQALDASPCDPDLTALLETAVAGVGVAVRRLPSGAGHDAMVMADLCPTAMLFLRCRGGISHNPAESVSPADAALAVRAMSRFIEALAESWPPTQTPPG